MPFDYEVPSFHGFASENSAMGWNYFVRHYASDTQQRRDPKYTAERDGVPVFHVQEPWAVVRRITQ